MHPAWTLHGFVSIIWFSVCLSLANWPQSGYIGNLLCLFEGRTRGKIMTMDCCNRCWVDCEAYLQDGHTTSGVYHVYPQGMRTGYDVYCDMTTDGGGWLVFQRRTDGSVDFYRDWASYERGFGNVSHEHWLGLYPLHRLQAKEQYELRIDMEDFDGNMVYASYNGFEISSAKDNFRLTVGLYDGNAGDSLSRQSGQMFSTKDRDNDIDSAKFCAQILGGAWWYDSCSTSNLNGLYTHVQDDSGYFIFWYKWKYNYYSLKIVEMKIRRA